MPHKISESQTAELEAVANKPARAAADEFRIIHENVPIKDRDGMLPPIIVTVAHIPGHGLIARQRFGNRNALWAWDPTLHTIGQQFQTFDGEGVLVNLVSTHSGNLVGHGPSPLEAEVLAEMKRTPALAEALDYARFLPKPLFDAGFIRVQRALKAGPTCPSIPWREFITNHTHGHFGNYGELEQDHEFTPAELFAIELCPVHLQNLHSLRTRTGSVRSEFTTGNGSTAFVLTAYMADKAQGIQTIAWVSPR